MIDVRPPAVASSGGIAIAITLLVLLLISQARFSSEARAAEPPNPKTLSEEEGARIDIAVTPPSGKTSEEAVVGNGTEAPALTEAPPMRPRHKGLVVESTLGMLAFVGEFRHVSPPAYWLHGQLGYELFPWLMVFGEGELALTDTSESQDESHTRAFSMWGFGGGLRATVHASDRVALYLQGDAGALTANVPHGALAILGFHDAESLNAAFGARLGVDWYQLDRHMALTAALGGRVAEGFAKSTGSTDFPAMWDVGAGLRYTF